MSEPNSVFLEGEKIQGVVTEVDEHVGLGLIHVEGRGLLPFHCINIVDGSRTIALDANISAEVFRHPRGRFEAREIVCLDLSS